MKRAEVLETGQPFMDTSPGIPLYMKMSLAGEPW